MASGTMWLKLNDEDLGIKADNKTPGKPCQIEVNTTNIKTHVHQNKHLLLKDAQLLKMGANERFTNLYTHL